MEMAEVKVLRSARRTLALEITREAELLVRAPYRVSEAQIRAFLDSHRAWICTHQAQMRRRLAAHPEPTAEEEAELRARAKAELPALTAYYGERMGLHANSVRITSARTRFGSCSAENRICYSWRLMRYPREAIEYVVVHELAHIAHKNHGAAFYACIAEILPDWKERRALLKE